MEKFEVIVVGGGLGGLAAAYSLAKDGIEVLLVERGDYSGSKNVTGGRIYLNPVRDLLPEIWEEAPLERHVTRETVTMMTQDSSASIDFSSSLFGQKPYHSHTILRAVFDRWLAEKVAEAGGMIISKNRVDSPVIEDGKVKGIIAGEDTIYADVVVAADGAMSLTAEKAGLRKPHKPEHMAVGVKEIIELPSQVIEDRFNLNDGEGAANLFMGSFTAGMFGGGFLYTNKNSLSLGLVIRISDLMQNKTGLEVPVLFEEFKNRPEIKTLIKGGESLEYSAHLIPEGGFNSLPRLFGDGILLVGDAAGLTINAGLTVRGMEFAIASGVMAARAIKKAREAKDFSRESLSYYERLLEESFVLKDLKTYRESPEFLDNQRLYTVYPELVCGALQKAMYISAEPKPRLSATVFKELRSRFSLAMLKDVFGVKKL